VPQLSLLGDVQEESAGGTSNEIRLRPYQHDISQQALSFFEQGKSVLTVAATGTGKTRIAAAVVRSFPGRVLWIAHRFELVSQAIRTLEELLGERVDVELPGRYSGSARVVVASKDTVRTKARLDRLKNFGKFDLIVIDEAHHSEARTYKVITNAYPDCLRYGLTATPGRLDRRHLSLFDESTEPFGITRATSQGYLVPITAKRDSFQSVNLSGVNTVAGDLDRQQLSAIMRSEENLHAVAKAILERQDHFPGLLFSPAVDVAERTCEIINRYRPGTARFVSGKTPDDERRGIFEGLGRSYQVLANYGIATEGTDLVNVRSVFMQRPTKSTALFQQMLGRGLRPLPGLVDGRGDSLSRKQAIQASSKPSCLVVDFVGVTGRHSIATAIDVLAEGQGTPGQAIERVRERLAKGEELNVSGAIAEEIEAYQERQRTKQARHARQLGIASRQAIVGTVHLSSRDVRLIGLGGVPESCPAGAGLWDGPPLPGQVDELRRLGISYSAVATARQAREAIGNARSRLNLATPKQAMFVEKHARHRNKPGLTKREAAYIISTVIQGWKR
jgi:superfamily II DNA or RNA helicase